MVSREEDRRSAGRTLRHQVEQFTRASATCYSDEWQGYNRLERRQRQVSHGTTEWARDDNGDGVREVHINTIEGVWTWDEELLASDSWRASAIPERVRCDV